LANKEDGMVNDINEEEGIVIMVDKLSLAKLKWRKLLANGEENQRKKKSAI